MRVGGDEGEVRVADLAPGLDDEGARGIVEERQLAWGEVAVEERRQGEHRAPPMADGRGARTVCFLCWEPEQEGQKRLFIYIFDTVCIQNELECHIGQKNYTKCHVGKNKFSNVK